jgi:calmodulin
MSNKINRGQDNDLKEVFDFFDQDGDGIITTEELGRAMEMSGQHLTNDDLYKMMHEADINGDCKVSFLEFQSLIKSRQRLDDAIDTEQELRQAFHLIDRDQDGYISRSELKRLSNCLNLNLCEDELDEIMSNADLNGDGKIDINEFLLGMKY